MAEASLPHLLRSGRRLTDPPVVVEFKGKRFGAEFVTGERLRDALVWHFRPAGQKLVRWTEAHLEETVTLRYRDGRSVSFPYGRLWRRLAHGADGDLPTPTPQGTSDAAG